MFTVLEMSNTTRPKAEPKYVTYDYFQQQLKSIDNATKQYTRNYINNTVSAIQSNVVNYSALSNQSKSLTDGVRTIDFDSITQSIQFRTNINQTTTPIKIHPITNTINNVSKINFNDTSTITGITSDSSNTDPTKAISANILTGINSRFKALEDKTQNQTATANETTFTGNVTADKFNGYYLKTVGNYHKLPEIVVINERSVVEIGRNLDFHDSTSTSVDYNGRISYKQKYFHCSDKFVVENGKDLQAANIISSKGNLNNIIDRTVALETKNTEQDTRLSAIETKNNEQDTRLDVLETKTQNQTATANETTFTGNITADTFNGFHLGMNDKFYNIPSIPVINNDLVMEVGRYIDFHYNNSTTTDYKSRLSISSPGNLHFDHSFILDNGDFRARNLISDKGDLNNIVDRTVALETNNTEQDTRLSAIETKNTEQDTRLTNIESKNTEQDTRLDTLETTTIPSITQNISNLQKADGILHEESVRYYDYSREHIEEIENTKIPAINTKNNEQDSRLTNIETKNIKQDEKLDNIINNAEKDINDKTLSLAINVQREGDVFEYPVANEYEFQLNPISDDIYLKVNSVSNLYTILYWAVPDETGVPHGQANEEINISYDGTNVSISANVSNSAIEIPQPTFDIDTKTLTVPRLSNYILLSYSNDDTTLKNFYCYHSYVIAQPFSKNIIDLIYPIGSIYLTFNQPPPVFGTWELLADGYFLRSTHTSPGESGGSLEHSHATCDHELTVDEMPAHNHIFLGPNNIDGNPDGQVDSNGSSTSSGYRYWRGMPLKHYDITTDYPKPCILNAGGNQAHNHGDTIKAFHIPPYITCFMYKRIA